MNLYRKIEKALLSFLNFVWRLFILIHEYKNIYRKHKLYKNVHLSKEQKKQIDSFYKQNYGKKISYKWHRLYQSYTGNFDYMYIPEYIYSTKLELLSNKRNNVLAYEDKNLLHFFWDNFVYVPKTYISCINGTVFDSEGNIINRDDILFSLHNVLGKNFSAVIKNTIDTGSGRDVNVVEIADDKDLISGNSFINLPTLRRDNFVVQEKIVAHPLFAALHPQSVNTLRVVTYIINNNFKTAPLVMRIGRGKNAVDNAHAGGIFIGVSDDGKLHEFAFSEYGDKFKRHPDSGIAFSGYQLPCVPKIIELAKKMHSNLPRLRFISWDFTVNDKEQIVLIETNLHSQTVWFPQMAHGRSMFGEDTAEMLKLVNRRYKK